MVPDKVKKRRETSKDLNQYYSTLILTTTMSTAPPHFRHENELSLS